MAAAANPVDLTQISQYTPTMNASRQRCKYLSAEEYSAFQELCAEYRSLDHSGDHPNARSFADAIIHKDINK
jgi:hypothetical protein